MALMGQNVLVAAPTAVSSKLTAILQSAGYGECRAVQTGGEAMRMVESRCPDVLITSYRLSDMMGIELAKSLSDTLSSIVITNESQRQLMEETPENVIVLSSPISKDAFLSTVSVMLKMNQSMHSLSKRVSELEKALEERKLMDRAKGLLMDQHHMTESQAHRLIQKMSMDRGMRLIDVVKAIMEGNI
ncbi:MAG: ANTAR domain-containing protein [Eubacteriales bacterium]|nr:ANTAR domain-containing protein [Eubacteriales bacterium]MDD3881982.1 ANTAR domain-containing protein [Eubacteriales bacterium]MDD4513117.1 ANTAR domain-containing protein [Eubacteriales bacterium]